MAAHIHYLFDIDGTLLRAGGTGARALDEVFRERYHVAIATAGIDFAGRTDPWILSEVFAQRFGRRPDDEEVSQLLAAYVPVLERELASSRTFRILPHVVEVLDWLAARPGVSVGVATGNVAAGARAKLERAGLAGRFAFGGYGCDSAVRADVVARAIERGAAIAGVADAVVVVGDTVHDVTAARACKAQVVAVATGFQSRDVLEAAAPDVVMDSLGELPAWHEARF